MKRNGNDNDRRENLCYIEADKPLVYNFFDVKTLQELIDKEPTSGKRKETKKKEDVKEKNENINENKKKKKKKKKK
jgi:hypothetical protein